jgi:predicted ATP-dependent endonuclease of OLD family
MIITNITIDNYRGIKADSFFPSPMTCIIGENNAGKSTILIAISLFFSGSSLSKSDFYNVENEISIELEFSNITESDLLRLTEEHRERINSIIIDGKLTLVRIYDIDGKSKLHCKKVGPKDPRLSENVINDLLKGKKGNDISESLKGLLPEYEKNLDNLNTQKAGKEKIEEIISALNEDELELKIANLPTGIDNSVSNFLPEPIYIAAVKDLKDDVKTKESTTFGKLLAILLRFLENTPEFDEIANSFEKLHGLLNVIENDDNLTDNRIKQIIAIESQIEGYLKENFPKVKVDISIPKPELKQVFSNSKIFINDGVRDTIETKGDGIKRALTFSLLRTYVDQLKEQKRQKQIEKNDDESIEITSQPYLFLFEEPELYLHPNAQKRLFDALESLSEENNQVFTTTHSPLFFSADSTGTFVKVKKRYPDDEKPFGQLLTINLSKDLTYKDAFQILCYENNTPAFFANKVLLVEGDSDLIYLKELSKNINPEWNFDNHNIPIVRINGKSNIKRFTDFYNRFETEVFSLVDLDMLIDGFEKFDCSIDINQKRAKLLDKIDEIANQKSLIPNLKKDKIRELTRRYTWKEKYLRLKELANKMTDGKILTDEEKSDIEFLFLEETNNLRRQVLISEDGDLDEKHELLDLLRKEKLFVLSNGAIEDYYPKDTLGGDKPTKAINAIMKIREMKDLQIFLPKIKQNGMTACEMTEIFKIVFA